MKYKIKWRNRLYWLAPFLICLPWMMRLNNDNYYMIATGEEIIKNGIPYINPFAAVDGLSIVIQNWVYCILNYAVYTLFGTKKALYIISVLQFLIFDFVLYKIVRCKCDGHDSGLFLLFSNIIFVYYMGCARPALLTFTFLIIEVKLFCDWCESGTPKSGRKLLFLFPITIFVANIQSSNLIFVLCPLLAYLAAKIWVGEWDRQLFFSICVLAPITVACMMINPYGVDGALYLFNSLGHVNASELEGVRILSIPGLFFIISCVLIIKYIMSQLNRIRTMEDNKLSLTYKQFIACGFFILSLICKRNQLFFVPAFILIWYEVNHCRLGFSAKPYRFINGTARSMLRVLVVSFASVVFLSAYVVRIAEALEIGTIAGIETHFGEKSGNEKFEEFLQAQGLPINGVTVFPGSAYLEMKGMKVFIDPRNEIYDKPINKKDNYYTMWHSLIENGRAEEFDSFFEEFQFDYYIASHDEENLLNYLENSDEFIRIFEDRDFYAYVRDVPKRYIYDYTKYSTGQVYRDNEAGDDYIEVTFLNDKQIIVNANLDGERKDYVFDLIQEGLYKAKADGYGEMHEVTIGMNGHEQLSIFVDESDCEGIYKLELATVEQKSVPPEDSSQ